MITPASLLAEIALSNGAGYAVNESERFAAEHLLQLRLVTFVHDRYVATTEKGFYMSSDGFRKRFA